jgi:hypothetical protein
MRRLPSLTAGLVVVSSLSLTATAADLIPLDIDSGHFLVTASAEAPGCETFHETVTLTQGSPLLIDLGCNRAQLELVGNQFVGSADADDPPVEVRFHTPFHGQSITVTVPDAEAPLVPIVIEGFSTRAAVGERLGGSYPVGAAPVGVFTSTLVAFPGDLVSVRLNACCGRTLGTEPVVFGEAFAVDPELPTPEPECRDGEDNDGDGRVDYPDDRQCGSPDDESERPPRGTPPGLAD